MTGLYPESYVIPSIKFLSYFHDYDLCIFNVLFYKNFAQIYFWYHLLYHLALNTTFPPNEYVFLKNYLHSRRFVYLSHSEAFVKINIQSLTIYNINCYKWTTKATTTRVYKQRKKEKFVTAVTNLKITMKSSSPLINRYRIFFYFMIFDLDIIFCISCASFGKGL